MAVLRPGTVARNGSPAVDGSIAYGVCSPDWPTIRVRGRYTTSGVTGYTIFTQATQFAIRAGCFGCHHWSSDAHLLTRPTHSRDGHICVDATGY
jgi:hypothetical protein